MATTVAKINWKESWSFNPCIIVHALSPIKYRLIIKGLEDGVSTIIPSLNTTLDELLQVLEGCFVKESNFFKVLKDWSGDEKVKAFKFDFNGIECNFEKGMTAEEVKSRWLEENEKRVRR